MAALVAGASGEEKLEDHEAELGEVRTRIDALRREMADAESEKDAQVRALREIEEQVGSVTRHIHDLEREQIIRRKRLDSLAIERQSREAEVAGQRQVLAEEVRASYAMGRQERLKLMLNQEDPALLGRILAYYEHLHRRRIARIDVARQALDRLKETERAITQEQSRLEELLVQEEVERVRLGQAQLVREQILASLESDIQVRGTEVSKLEQDETRLKELVERLKQMQERLASIGQIENEAAVQTGPFSDQKGKLLWPTPGRLLASFGGLKGGGLAWDGAVITAPAGEPVRAVHRGRVVFADWLKGYGLMLILDHGDGYMSLYGYNQSLFKEAGDWVEPGEVVAVVGKSGGRTDPALYFGIRHNGKPVDPAQWCRRAKGNRVSLVDQAQWRYEHAG